MADSEATMSKKKYSKKKIREVLDDYRLARISREMSIIGRREVLTGQAKFGIFGDGKELPQIALAKQFRNGDFRSGYYRDQTLMLAIGELTVQQFFAQLYAHPDIQADPQSGGRQMNAHFASRLLDEEGSWRSQTEMKNTSADLSPTAGQMPRLLGLAQASRIYRESEELKDRLSFSRNGNEIAFGTIGDASTSEGLFWETVNAAGVLQVPMVLSVWDDGFGISVPKKYQTVRESISKALSGFRRTETEAGFEIITVKAWDYEELLSAYSRAANLARSEHIPVLVHVEEATQVQGHSSSGSQERYKSKERLEWEKEYCCCRQMRRWILEEDISDPDELDRIEEEAKKNVLESKRAAAKEFELSISRDKEQVLAILKGVLKDHPVPEIENLYNGVKSKRNPVRKDIVLPARISLRYLRGEKSASRSRLLKWLEESGKINCRRYNSHLLSESSHSPLYVKEVKPEYSDDPDMVDGRIVLRDNFDKLLETYPEIMIFGEDTGRLGDVNLGLEGLQKKYGELRVADTGIREATILGQGIGLALRGLRPIAEIQYLDYLLFCFQGMSDDLATLRFRTAGGQAAPMIVRTRGHRLEGIWHSGSPMGMIINGIRGIHVCVPRNLTDSAGFYNTIIQGDDPALIIEPLNAYRIKEKLPLNPGEYTVPLGIPEIVRRGSDITIVSYGPTCTIVEAVLPDLEQVGISAELIDVRTLLPFDLNSAILESLRKTNRIIFIDEDVPGGATAYMMQKVIEEQEGFRYLDSKPRTLTARSHRSPFGTDGDYFSKPSSEDVFDAVYGMMQESNPSTYPSLD